MQSQKLTSGDARYICLPSEQEPVSHSPTPKWKCNAEAYLLKLEKTFSFQLVSKFSHIVNKYKNCSELKITVVNVKRESNEHLEAQKADAIHAPWSHQGTLLRRKPKIRW